MVPSDSDDDDESEENDLEALMKKAAEKNKKP